MKTNNPIVGKCKNCNEYIYAWDIMDEDYCGNCGELIIIEEELNSENI